MLSRAYDVSTGGMLELANSIELFALGNEVLIQRPYNNSAIAMDEPPQSVEYIAVNYIKVYFRVTVFIV